MATKIFYRLIIIAEVSHFDNDELHLSLKARIAEELFKAESLFRCQQ